MSEQTATVPHQVWRRPMVGRRTDEEHRSAAALELFFDLCFVIAVAQAAGGLHRLVSENSIADGVIAYFLVFFAVWWAWMNFTWFASAYDTDDIAYRATTLVQIAGALVFAAGVPPWWSPRRSRRDAPSRDLKPCVDPGAAGGTFWLSAKTVSGAGIERRDVDHDAVGSDEQRPPHRGRAIVGVLRRVELWVRHRP